MFYLVHMIMILIFRDACFTTQPLELLNSLGFRNSKSQRVVLKDVDANGDRDVSGNDSPNDIRNENLERNSEGLHLLIEFSFLSSSKYVYSLSSFLCRFIINLCDCSKVNGTREFPT